jgi:hypothetical protein
LPLFTLFDLLTLFFGFILNKLGKTTKLANLQLRINYIK